jgi:hypothetical protein
LLLLLKGLLDPILLVGVLPSSNDVLLASTDICLNVLNLGILVGDIFPSLLSLDHDPLVQVLALVALSSSYARFGEVHDVESVGLALVATLRPKIEPLLMASSVGIDLHEQVVDIGAEGLLFCLKKVARFKEGVHQKDGAAVLHLQPLNSVLVLVDVLE